MKRYAIDIERAVGKHSASLPDVPGGVATGDTFQEVGGAVGDGIAFHLNGLREDRAPLAQPSALLSVGRSPRDVSAKRSVDWLRVNTFEGRCFFPGPRSRCNHWQHPHRDKRNDLTPPRRPYAFGEFFKEPSWRPRNAVGIDAIVGILVIVPMPYLPVFVRTSSMHVHASSMLTQNSASIRCATSR